MRRGRDAARAARDKLKDFKNDGGDIDAFVVGAVVLLVLTSVAITIVQMNRDSIDWWNPSSGAPIPECKIKFSLPSGMMNINISGTTGSPNISPIYQGVDSKASSSTKLHFDIILGFLIAILVIDVGSIIGMYFMQKFRREGTLKQTIDDGNVGSYIVMGLSIVATVLYIFAFLSSISVYAEYVIANEAALECIGNDFIRNGSEGNREKNLYSNCCITAVATIVQGLWTSFLVPAGMMADVKRKAKREESGGETFRLLLWGFSSCVVIVFMSLSADLSFEQTARESARTDISEDLISNARSCTANFSMPANDIRVNFAPTVDISTNFMTVKPEHIRADDTSTISHFILGGTLTAAIVSSIILVVSGVIILIGKRYPNGRVGHWNTFETFSSGDVGRWFSGVNLLLLLMAIFLLVFSAYMSIEIFTTNGNALQCDKNGTVVDILQALKEHDEMHSVRWYLFVAVLFCFPMLYTSIGTRKGMDAAVETSPDVVDTELTDTPDPTASRVAGTGHRVTSSLLTRH